MKIYDYKRSYNVCFPREVRLNNYFVESVNI